MTLHNSPSQRAREQFLYPKAAKPQDAPSKTALKVQKLLTPELLGQQGRENRLLQQGSKRVGGVTGVDPNAFGDFGSNGRFAQVSVDKREAPPGARSAAGEHEAAGVFLRRSRGWRGSSWDRPY
ncbi:hypothetical protein CIP107578_02340 [Corynebacterium diphtheriae]|nr:hypothetical protein CIP107558_02334 [Corynebacterium diphtheriae]CAB0671153.1 hypothetical protein CIP107578_02340 [Corynebacterium diphtheriae]